jgi:hypothetical protein
MRFPVPDPGGDYPPQAAGWGRDEPGVATCVADAVRAAVVAGEAVIRSVVRRPSPAGADPSGGDTGAARVHETLIYELLDAHADTADLAADLGAEPHWAAHLDYLRALQREGRQTLAQILLEDQR